MGWDEKDLMAWNIYTLGVVQVFIVILAGIIAWRMTNNIPQFLLYFGFFLMAVTMIFVTQVCRISLLGRSECLGIFSILTSLKRWYKRCNKRALTCLFICLIILGGALILLNPVILTESPYLLIGLYSLASVLGYQYYCSQGFGARDSVFGGVTMIICVTGILLLLVGIGNAGKNISEEENVIISNHLESSKSSRMINTSGFQKTDLSTKLIVSQSKASDSDSDLSHPDWGILGIGFALLSISLNNVLTLERSKGDLKDSNTRVSGD